ncbi:MAG TPA: DUF2231 domain-containing protein, partial [Anaerolineae bacterium]
MWTAALVFDVLANLGIGGNAMVRTSFYAIGLGLLVALLAIPTGLADWWDISQDKPAWNLGLYHMILNIVVTIVWAVNFYLRLDTAFEATTVATVPLALSVLGALILFVSGYLGGRMVYNYGTSVARNSKQKWRRIAEAG